MNKIALAIITLTLSTGIASTMNFGGYSREELWPEKQSRFSVNFNVDNSRNDGYITGRGSYETDNTRTTVIGTTGTNGYLSTEIREDVSVSKDIQASVRGEIDNTGKREVGATVNKKSSKCETF